MKTKMYIGSSRDSDVGCGNVLMFTEQEVMSVSHSEEGWTLITVGNGIDGCVYDLSDLKVVEGEFTVRDPLPSDSKY